jgi:hypothetical protein
MTDTGKRDPTAKPVPRDVPLDAKEHQAGVPENVTDAEPKGHPTSDRFQSETTHDRQSE